MICTFLLFYNDSFQLIRLVSPRMYVVERLFYNSFNHFALLYNLFNYMGIQIKMLIFIYKPTDFENIFPLTYCSKKLYWVDLFVCGIKRSKVVILLIPTLKSRQGKNMRSRDESRLVKRGGSEASGWAEAK